MGLSGVMFLLAWNLHIQGQYIPPDAGGAQWGRGDCLHALLVWRSRSIWPALV